MHKIKLFLNMEINFIEILYEKLKIYRSLNE